MEVYGNPNGQATTWTLDGLVTSRQARSTIWQDGLDFAHPADPLHQEAVARMGHLFL